MKKIQVLIVDDSALVRQSLRDVLESDPGITVLGAARDPFVAAGIMAQAVPDVIVLDVEMPRMDGISFLHRIMTQHPIPVVICSTATEIGSEATLIKALEYGAVEIIQKPKVSAKKFIEESRLRICDVVRAAAGVRVRRLATRSPRQVAQKLTADVILPPPGNRPMAQTTERVVAIGASTGGTEALRVVLEALPEDSSGIVVVQHMPEGFTRAFAERLDRLCRINVKEAENDDTVLRGRALIAPGNRHVLLKRSGARYYVEVKDGPLVCRHRPSVDVLFRSTARYAGRNAMGIIMTGMGDDGAQGMLEMKNTGAYTIAQDEASCVVYGMPREAVRVGAVDQVIPLEQIARRIVQLG